MWFEAWSWAKTAVMEAEVMVRRSARPWVGVYERGRSSKRGKGGGAMLAGCQGGSAGGVGERGGLCDVEEIREVERGEAAVKALGY